MILRSFSIAWSALVTASMLWLLVRGYRRRRPHWSARSWLRFLGVSIVGIALSAVVFYESWVADRWFAATLEASRDATSLWALAVLAVMVVGCGIFAITLTWFGAGEPTREFPAFRRR